MRWHLHEVEQLPDERSLDCGSGFARDLKDIGYRRHLECNPIIYGGMKQSWGEGHRTYIASI